MLSIPRYTDLIVLDNICLAAFQILESAFHYIMSFNAKSAQDYLNQGKSY